MYIKWTLVSLVQVLLVDFWNPFLPTQDGFVVRNAKPGAPFFLWTQGGRVETESQVDIVENDLVLLLILLPLCSSADWSVYSTITDSNSIFIWILTNLETLHKWLRSPEVPFLHNLSPEATVIFLNMFYDHNRMLIIANNRVHCDVLYIYIYTMYFNYISIFLSLSCPPSTPIDPLLSY